MSYGDVDQFDVSRNTRYLLPLELDKKLYTADQISEMLARGRDPLELSIDKWERLAEVLNILYKKTSPEKYLHNLQDRIGYKTCALCIASIEKYTTLHGKIKVKEDKCSVCPLARVDRCIDSKSAYMGIERIIKKFVENLRIG